VADIHAIAKSIRRTSQVTAVLKTVAAPHPTPNTYSPQRHAKGRLCKSITMCQELATHNINIHLGVRMHQGVFAITNPISSRLHDSRSFTISRPSFCNLPIMPFTLSYVNMVVIAAGTARIMFVPIPA